MHLSNVPALINHDPKRVVARTFDRSLRLYTDHRGLMVICEPSAADGRLLIEAIRTDRVAGMSFNGETIRSHVEETIAGPVNVVDELKLNEVTFLIDKTPVNRNTVVCILEDWRGRRPLCGSDDRALCFKALVELANHQGRNNNSLTRSDPSDLGRDHATSLICVAWRIDSP